MENFELAGIAFALTLAIGLVVYIGHIWRKSAIQKAEDEAQRRYKEELERARIARAEARASRTNLAQPKTGVTSVSTEAIARKYNATTPARTSTTSATTVVRNDSDDLLTAMILQNAMNSSSDTTAGTVSWNDNTPTITPVAPEPERETYSSSYSSSSSDDSNSRSSYSSSYSSSSDSGSSYSSSSSDSSYSSSSDSGSSSSSD